MQQAMTFMAAASGKNAWHHNAPQTTRNLLLLCPGACWVLSMQCLGFRKPLHRVLHQLALADAPLLPRHPE